MLSERAPCKIAAVAGRTATFDRQGLHYRGSGDFKYYHTKGRIVAIGTFTITTAKILVQAPQK